MKYRREQKYILSNKETDLLVLRLKDVLSLDSHGNNGNYQIRSLYLDSFDEKVLKESLDGLNNRSKYRFRYYNNDTSLIKLERKTTINDMKNKIAVNMDISKITNFIDNKLLEDDSLISAEIKSNHYYPNVIIEYDRLAFINEVGNIRITIDSNINVSQNVNDFFSKDIYGYPVLPINRKILEVKYDNILPGYISKILNVDSLERVSYSKYTMGMNILKNNGRLDEIYEF